MLQSKVRKACDLCYRRRMKCDSQKPRCSNCILHDSVCTFEATSRKARPRHQASGEDIGVLRSQVERLESSLGLALERIDELQSLVPRRDTALAVLAPPVYASDLHEDQFDVTPKELPSSRMELPPLQEVISATESYLLTLNSVLPLFHPGRLLQSINHWYAHPGRRDRRTWAAINVVLALAYRRIPPGEATLGESTAYYMHNAQTVLSEVIMGEADLLNVQILVGMVMLFQGMQDLRPATMLIAIALRLAHELGLHTRRAEHLETSHALERDRVFWIAYILDRDISMRTRRPPVQREIDIDLEWPSAEPEDGAGNVTDVHGIFQLNFLRYRVRLAWIQGEVYDSILATRAEMIDNENIVRLNNMLDDWISSIPTPFRPSSVLQAGEPHMCRCFAVLYATHLACRTQVYQAHAMASRWMQSLQGFGKTVTQQGHIVPAPLPTPSPQDWKKLLHEAREYMRLSSGVEGRDQAFIWMTACTYVSGSVCLTANAMFEPSHAYVEDDLSLVKLSISLLEDLIQQTGHKPLEDLRDTCEELLRYACALTLRADI